MWHLPPRNCPPLRCPQLRYRPPVRLHTPGSGCHTRPRARFHQRAYQKSSRKGRRSSLDASGVAHQCATTRGTQQWLSALFRSPRRRRDRDRIVVADVRTAASAVFSDRTHRRRCRDEQDEVARHKTRLGGVFLDSGGRGCGCAPHVSNAPLLSRIFDLR